MGQEPFQSAFYRGFTFVGTATLACQLRAHARGAATQTSATFGHGHSPRAGIAVGTNERRQGIEFCGARGYGCGAGLRARGCEGHG